MLNNLKEVAIALGKNKKLYAFGIVIMERCFSFGFGCLGRGRGRGKGREENINGKILEEKT